MIGYQIMVHERREDPEDWTCQCNLNDSWRYDNKVYLDIDLSKDILHMNHLLDCIKYLD